ncbi:hypothetical protein N781_12745 [Pontibacillus halophilus JSM 076056 = DSM 19796]|uniref:Putative cysteine ligase BshC n=1 Tax=Pontibacillus halophilus JSM 076056 = DSM 19796 TaxID=1385510 RepID=A0A0A5GJ32_9BACI|nr:bacillithiol biosynthesis cysteine-adding enzyme BshC [Pontibacillus halophilus]KGX93271.1 hypothetical protein N781_12745 [Pontibacillus halophilus JSM 076056 = DSM 19796]
MRIQPIQLTSQNRLVKAYREQSDQVIEKFDYNPWKQETFQQRINDIKEQHYQREQLVAHLREVNERWGAPQSTFNSIEELKREDSVVVVGGQQAGLLTGPLYTIHKIISILDFAKKETKALGVPVLPVFWIAGEDHDYDEINHIYLSHHPRMKKFKVLQKQLQKLSVSEMEMDHEAMNQWVERLFSQLDETAYTKDLKSQIQDKLSQSRTFVDFFARILFGLFQEEGLILLDSHDPGLRKLETPYFDKMIQSQPAIAEGVERALHHTAQQGYPVNLDATHQDGHLFYTHEGERVLLVRNEDGHWEGKQGECRCTTEELRRIAEESPHLLSNNVVTRPLMQEFVLPTLAFIAGPGEVAYWSALKPAFHAVGLHMPPVLPRISISLLDRKSEKWLHRHQIAPSMAINEGVSHYKSHWIAMQSYPPVVELADEVKRAVERAHRPLKDKAHEIRDDIGQLAEKNLFHLFRDVEFLQERMEKALEEQHSHELQIFDELDLTLHPEGGLQERIWNVLPWLNKYGFELPSKLNELEYDWECEHHLIYV